MLPYLELDNKQERHMLGQEGYIEGRSYYESPFDVDKVKTLFKDGVVLLTQKGDWDKKMILIRVSSSPHKTPYFRGFMGAKCAKVLFLAQF
ncbi:polymorphic toxin type 50 domain-containing protein [Helicobacter felis]|uniref:polymorphic toxin type 50 domain-containing protein n=1 Tax=Helicobacter felis TaxID=214 RepID=UPI000EF6D806